MAHDMSGAAEALMAAMMILMMAAMAGVSFAYLARKPPATWLARIPHPGRKPGGPAAGARPENTR